MGDYKDLVDGWGEREKPAADALYSWYTARYIPSSVVDVGCGSGVFLDKYKESGIEILGVDFEENSRERLGGNLIVADLTKPLVLPKKYDLAMCFEVFEHIPEEFADVAVESLSKASDRIIFSAAQPNQVGTNHINCQTKGYWLGKFAKFGIEIDIFDSECLLTWAENSGHFANAHWLVENMMVLKRVKWD